MADWIVELLMKLLMSLLLLLGVSYLWLWTYNERAHGSS